MIIPDTGDGHKISDTQAMTAVPGQTPIDGHLFNDTQIEIAADGPLLDSGPLNLLAKTVDELEGARKATQNRLRDATTPRDKGGYGLTAENGVVAFTMVQLARQWDEEGSAVKQLEQVMREHPLGPWCAARRRVGAKQLARLLGAIGDPYWHPLHNRPRTFGELVSYCGWNPVDGVIPKWWHRGRSKWNPNARMRVYLIADMCVLKDSHYRHVYDATREKYTDAVHTKPCVQCGKRGSPAEVGTPVKPGHQHARARHAMGRAMLEDLYTEAQRLHETQAAASRSATPIQVPPLPAQNPTEAA